MNRNLFRAFVIAVICIKSLQAQESAIQQVPQGIISQTEKSAELATVYIAYSSTKTNYYNFKIYYEIDGQFVATTVVQEYFKVQMPVGIHNICAYMNPKKVKKDNTIDAKTKYYNNLEEIKQKSIYEPDCQRINVLPGENYFQYSYDMIILTKSEFQEHLTTKGFLVRESPAIVPSLVPQDMAKITTNTTNTQTMYSPKKSEVNNNIPIVKAENDNTYVLIIANENYQNLSSVAFAVNDGQIFKNYCIQTLGVPEKQVRYCVNTTYGEMVGAVDWLKYALNNFENSKAIVYYCGHGIPDEKTGQAYLIPVDGKGTNMTTCYSLKNLYKTLAATKAQSITYFMDACFTGANKEGSMLVVARGVAREPMKETLAGKTIVFSASSGDETAMTLEEQGHGLFTYYLLKKLQETEGNVTYGELADYINKNVKKDAFLINEKPQTPIVATSPAVQNTWKTMKLK